MEPGNPETETNRGFPVYGTYEFSVEKTLFRQGKRVKSYTEGKVRTSKSYTEGPRLGQKEK